MVFLIPKLDECKKSTTYSGANLTTVSVQVGMYRALPYPHHHWARPLCVAAFIAFLISKLHKHKKSTVCSKQTPQTTLWGTQSCVAALWRPLLAKLYKYKKSTVCSEQTLWNTVCEEYTVLFSLQYSIKTATDYIALQVTTHRLHSGSRLLFEFGIPKPCFTENSKDNA